jgi:hypothetical protein
MVLELVDTGPLLSVEAIFDRVGVEPKCLADGADLLLGRLLQVEPEHGLVSAGSRHRSLNVTDGFGGTVGQAQKPAQHAGMIIGVGRHGQGQLVPGPLETGRQPEDARLW